jgi:zinc protease
MRLPPPSPWSVRAVAAAIALAVAPGGDARAAPVRVPTTKIELKNGLTVLLHEDHSLPRVHVSVRYAVGSGREVPGRTGLAHLFEHLMFEGSKNVPEGKFDEWLEAAGGENNAWTSEDATYYYEEVPPNALELALFLESDRMGFFLERIDDALVDGQRDVVKNERRQSYENRPWGNAELLLPAVLWPRGHPYAWPVIGSMDDLSAASREDVQAFFATWYAPANAILTLVGDFETAHAKALVEKWFADVPRRASPPAEAPAPGRSTGEKRLVVEDVKAPLPKLTIAWPTVAVFDPDDAALDLAAAVLGSGPGSRLQERLVHALRLAQDVQVQQQSMTRAGELHIEVVALPEQRLEAIVAVIDEELARLVRDGVSEAELRRARAGAEMTLLDDLDGLSSKALRLSSYQAALDEPDAFERDLARYRSVTAQHVVDVVKRRLGRGRVVMSVVPKGRLDLAVVSASAAGRGGAP